MFQGMLEVYKVTVLLETLMLNKKLKLKIILTENTPQFGNHLSTYLKDLFAAFPYYNKQHTILFRTMNYLKCALSAYSTRHII
jgi:hypothetical protein